MRRVLIGYNPPAPLMFSSISGKVETAVKLRLRNTPVEVLKKEPKFLDFLKRLSQVSLAH